MTAVLSLYHEKSVFLLFEVCMRVSLKCGEKASFPQVDPRRRAKTTENRVRTKLV